MKAVGYKTPGSLDREDSLVDIELEDPQAKGRDLLVRVHAVSVNPVDYKLRASRHPVNDPWAVLGFDASGVVEAVGQDARHYKEGDEVFYAGSLTRSGTNSELHLVDERIVGKAPTSLNHAESAALPLTALTAWEMLFDRLDVTRPTAEGANLILIIGGAGGVGSIAIQLLRALTELTIITTASRPETVQWVKECGAHHVVDHRSALAPQIASLGLGSPGFVFSTTQTDKHLQDILELIAPQGRFGLIDDPPGLDVMPFKLKALSVHWELMFTRSLFSTADIDEQRHILDKVAQLVDRGKLRTTLTEVGGRIDAENLKKAHALLESGAARGKIVLEGFQ